MFIRIDSNGEIVTVAPSDEPLADSISVNDSLVPSDWSQWNTSKYRFVNGSFVQKEGWSEPAPLDPGSIDHDAIIARMRKKIGE